jgi:hypothetical protein
MSDKIVSAGNRIRGNFGMLAGDMAKAGLVAGGAGLAGGIGMAAAKGIELNDTLEQGALALGTMYSTFGVTDSFEKNIELAKAMQQELVKIADDSPATNEEIAIAYQSMAPAVSGVTQDLERQRALMEKIAVLGWTTGGDYKQLGQDVGRIVTGVAGADVSAFRTLAPTLKTAFEEVTGKKVTGDFAAEFNKVAKANGETALKIFEKAIEKVGPEVNEVFGKSFTGIVSTTESKLAALGRKFGEPMFESAKDALNKLNSEGSFGDEKTFTGLKTAALFAGGVLAKGMTRGIEAIDRGMTYVSQHWVEIATMIRDAGVAAGVAIKTALVVGGTRLVAGTLVAAAGKAVAGAAWMRDAGKPVLEWIGKQAKTTHMGLARGMKGKGTGILGGMGRGMGKVFGKADGKKDPLNIFRGMDKGILKVASLVTTIGSLGAVAGIAAVALGGIGVVIAGVGAYIISKWDDISGAIVKGLEDGSITLVPFITSLYTFYLRLELVGKALLGGGNAVDTVNGGLNMMTQAVDLASGTLSWFIKGLSIMVGAWGTLKLGMMGILVLIEQIVRLGVKLRVVDQSVLDQGRKNMKNFSDGIQDTFTRADQLASAADKIADAKLSPLDIKKAEEDAKKLQQSLADALKGVDNKGNSKRGTGSKVKINKVEVHIDMRDPDPDRLMAGLVQPLERMADKRTQTWEALEGGN